MHYDHLEPQQLEDWRTGKLNDAESLLVEDHLEECDGCAAMLDGLGNEQLADRIRDVLQPVELEASKGLEHGGQEWLLERAGTVIGPYKLLKLMGEGGMGSVWQAEQTDPVKRSVALKIIKAGMDTKEVIARFETERQALAMMHHPNIAHVLDAGATKTGRPYFVMELVEGTTITTFCDEQRLPTNERLNLFCELCDGIQHAHKNGVIHRDIKPSNVLVEMIDGKAAVKVIDFGVAKAVGTKLTEKTLCTALGQLIGTPAYMSPEQAELSGSDLDTRTDVYSLGVLLYELLTGATPLDATRLQKAGYREVQRMIREDDPPTPSTRISSLAIDASLVAEQRATVSRDLVRSLRGDLDVIVMKAIEKEPNRRYMSPIDFADDVRRYLHREPITARPASWAYRLKRLYQRNKVEFVAASTIAALLLAGTVTSSILAFRAIKSEGLAEQRLAEVSKEQRKTQAALSESEAVMQLLSEVFQSPDPTRDGRLVTVVEMLDRQSQRIATELANHPDRQAIVRAVFADTYESLSMYVKALQLRKQVYDHWLTTRGGKDAKTLDAQYPLAKAHISRRQTLKAAPLCEELVPLLTEKYGVEHEKTILAESCLADSLQREDAVRTLEIRSELLERSRKSLGSAHPTTLTIFGNLAYSYFYKGDFKQAAEHYEDVLQLRRNVLGSEHPDTLDALAQLAFSYQKLNQFDKAMPLAEQCRATCLRVMGPTHTATLLATDRLADAHEAIGEIEKSIELREIALKNRLAREPQHYKFNMSVAFLVRRYGLFGYHDRCAALGRDYVESIEKQYGAEHNSTVFAMNLTSYSLSLRPGAGPEAIQLAFDYAKRSCELRPESKEHWLTLGMVQYRAGNWNEALQALDRNQALLPAEKPAANLFRAMTFWQLDRLEKARQELREAKAILNTASAPNRWHDYIADEASGLIESGNERETSSHVKLSS